MRTLFAYLDPATSSLILQTVLGTLAAIALFGKRIFYFFRKLFRRERTPETQPVGSERTR